ncbi:unnamed protein product [Rotaria sp. Silwood2]|nr:unnamed protein product [Rotaria sp. Silwood2]CAF3387316.1 unnamed protein product [Rotaria sp. Silwood2]
MSIYFLTFILCPAISAISLSLVGHPSLGTRIGRNQPFSAAGNVILAVIMELLGYYVSTQLIFLFVIGVSILTLIALSCICQSEINYERRRTVGKTETGMTVVSFKELLLLIIRDQCLLIIFSCVILFISFW